MTLIQRKAIPRSMIKVTAMTEVVINTTIKNISMFKFSAERVRGRDTGGSIVEESNQHITIILSDGAAHVAGPLGEGRRVLHCALAERTKNFADFIPIYF